MSTDELPDHVHRLYGLDPSDFTAERNAVVKELKKAKRTADAEVIAALRKPSAVEHALNTVARESHDVAVRWAKAVASAIKAQSATIGGDSGTSFREATAELRAATGALVNAAVGALGGGNAETKRGPIAGAVQSLSAGNGPKLLLEGLVGSAALEAETDVFAGAPDPPATGPNASKKQSKGPSPVEVARRKRLEDKRDNAAATVQHAESALGSAERSLATARARLQQIEEELQAFDG